MRILFRQLNRYESYRHLRFNVKNLVNGKVMVTLRFVEIGETFSCFALIKPSGDNTYRYDTRSGNIILCVSAEGLVSHAKSDLLDFAEDELMKTLEISTAISMYRVEQATRYNTEIRTRRMEDRIEDLRWFLNRQLSELHARISCQRTFRDTPEGYLFYHNPFKRL